MQHLINKQLLEIYTKKNNHDLYLTIEELNKCVRSLNSQQRRIFDDIIEKLADPDVEKSPFYLYLGGEAGKGKSYLEQSIIAALKHISKKSGKGELEKLSILVMAPTTNAAFLIGRKTIDSALAVHMKKARFHEIPGGKISLLISWEVQAY